MSNKSFPHSKMNKHNIHQKFLSTNIGIKMRVREVQVRRMMMMIMMVEYLRFMTAWQAKGFHFMEILVTTIYQTFVWFHFWFCSILLVRPGQSLLPYPQEYNNNSDECFTSLPSILSKKLITFYVSSSLTLLTTTTNWAWDDFCMRNVGRERWE